MYYTKIKLNPYSISKFSRPGCQVSARFEVQLKVRKDMPCHLNSKSACSNFQQSQCKLLATDVVWNSSMGLTVIKSCGRGGRPASATPPHSVQKRTGWFHIVQVSLISMTPHLDVISYYYVSQWEWRFPLSHYFCLENSCQTKASFKTGIN